VVDCEDADLLVPRNQSECVPRLAGEPTREVRHRGHHLDAVARTPGNMGHALINEDALLPLNLVGKKRSKRLTVALHQSMGR
jgi:hypothetical protein